VEPQHQTPDQTESILDFDIGRYLQALRRYAWIVIALVVLGITGAVVYTKRQPSIYEAQASVQIEPKLPDLVGQGQEILSGGLGIGGTNDYYKQQKQVLGSYTLIRQTVEQHQLYTRLLTEVERLAQVKDQVELATQRLQKTLQINYPDQNRIMYVIVRNESSQLAADIANFHIATYLDYSRGLLSFDTKQASGALSTEFDDIEKKLREAESGLYKFQEDQNLLTVSLQDRQSIISTNITSYTQKLNEAKSARIELYSRLERLRKAASLDVLESPILLMNNNASFENLRAQYYTERNKFIELEKQVGPKHTDYQMQKAKMDDLYAALKLEAKRLLAGFEEQHYAALATERGLQAEVDRSTKEALELGPKIVEYNELLRRRKSLEDRYNILRTRLSASELTNRVNNRVETSNVRPLDPARPSEDPVAPNMRVNVLIAGIISLGLGLGIVVLIAFLDRSIKTVQDAQQAAGVPVLGVVPMLGETELAKADDYTRDRFVHDNPKSQLAEYCRSLRTNIMFSAADRELKTIVVSSANPREGKTTCVIYLGTTMAQSNQRVLLIDTDMRRPRLHSLIGGARKEGLSNLILGDRTQDEVIKTTDIPNLFVLPCGPLPPNPAELLMSNRFVTVLDELRERFDRIILDSPPLQAVTDAVVLSKHTDGVILVVRAGSTLRDDIKRSARQIRGVGSTIFGVIVNGSQNDRDGNYYSYYGYGEKTAETPG
jgi:succinoglycan biosynthesis transport protein ExoP